MYQKNKKTALSSLSNSVCKNLTHTIPPYDGQMTRSERTSLCILKKAALTVEAAMVVPIFVMLIVCIASIMRIYSGTLETMSSLRDASEQAAILVSVVDADTWIDLPGAMTFKPFYMPAGVSPVTVWCKGSARSWVGRDAEGAAEAGKAEAPEYVYVTEYASVYHTSSECSHLHLSIHSVDASSLPYLRNESGAKYKPCEKCAAHSGAAGTVYITEDGDRYHTSAGCSGLKRTVRMVEADEAEGLRECSRCASNGSQQL